MGLNDDVMESSDTGEIPIDQTSSIEDPLVTPPLQNPEIPDVKDTMIVTPMSDSVEVEKGTSPVKLDPSEIFDTVIPGELPSLKEKFVFIQNENSALEDLSYNLNMIKQKGVNKNVVLSIESIQNGFMDSMGKTINYFTDDPTKTLLHQTTQMLINKISERQENVKEEITKFLDDLMNCLLGFGTVFQSGIESDLWINSRRILEEYPTLISSFENRQPAFLFKNNQTVSQLFQSPLNDIVIEEYTDNQNIIVYFNTMQSIYKSNAKLRLFAVCEINKFFKEDLHRTSDLADVHLSIESVINNTFTKIKEYLELMSKYIDDIRVTLEDIRTKSKTNICEDKSRINYIVENENEINKVFSLIKNEGTFLKTLVAYTDAFYKFMTAVRNT